MTALDFEQLVSETPGPLLVTGSSGFVGRRALQRLGAAGVAAYGLVRDPALVGGAGPVQRVLGDLLDRAGLRRVVSELRPAWILHLGAVASPRTAAERPDLAWATNVGGTLNVLLGARDVGARVLLASTAQVYGRRSGSLAESEAPRPGNVYARTKLAAERLVQRFGRCAGQALVARPFNHSGPGQSSEYVLPAFAEALLRAAANGAPVQVGNLEPERDFLHVDDVLDAYGLLLARGRSGEVYNVCRGEGARIGALLGGLGERLGLDEQALGRLVRPDPYRMRADDPARLVGDGAKLAALGFTPRRSIGQLLDDVVQGARASEASAS